jgi:hypothetical protein
LRSILRFLDLGGSERICESTTTLEQRNEGIAINKSLFDLKTVTLALSKSLPHIPYNNDPLTKHLKDSFEGNSHIAVITCISPSDRISNRIWNTLDFVSGMKKKPSVTKTNELVGKNSKQLIHATRKV